MQQPDRQTGRGLPVLFSCLAALVLLLAGCGSVPATSEGMAASAYDVEQKHSYSVEVLTSGGEVASVTHPAQITDAVLAQAIEEAILGSGVFNEVRPAPAADYQLSVHLFSLEQPTMGFSMSVRMEAGWTLKRLADDQIIWRESIASLYTANTADAFAAVERLRLATEGAARNNILKGIRKLSELDL